MSLAWAKGSTRAHRRWRLAVLQRDHWVCQVRLKCEGDRATEADHIVPLVAGGAPLDLANGRASCKPCNAARGGAEAHRATSTSVPAPRTWSW